MPHFRAQMNCVPGMVTEFGFTPKFTTEEMRLNPEVMAKTNAINKIRKAKGEDLMSLTIYFYVIKFVGNLTTTCK